MEPAVWRRWLADHWILLVAVAIVLGVGARNDVRLSIWLDESYSLDTARRALPETFSRALQFELQPPLYFVLLNLWLRVSPTVEWARALSTMAIVLTIVVVDRLARQVGASRALPLLVALSPTLLWAASEARGYALAVLWTALALYAFSRAWFSRRAPSAGDVAAFVAAAYAALLTFYYTGFVIAAAGIAGVGLRPRARSMWVALGALTLLMLPWVPTIVGQVSQHPQYNPPLRGAANVAGWLQSAVHDVVFRHSAVLDRPGGRLAVVLVLLLLIAVRVASLRRRPWTRVESAFAIVALAPLAALALARVSNTVLVESRHWAPASIGLLVFLALVVHSCERPRRRRALLAGMLVVECAAAFSFVQNWNGAQDWRSALTWMRSHGYRPDDPVCLFNGEQVGPFLAVAPGARVFGIPTDPDRRRYALEDQVLRSADEVESRIAAVAVPGTSFWLVRWTGLTDFWGPRFLDAFIRSRAEVLNETDVTGLLIQRLRLRQGLPVGPRTPVAARRGQRGSH